MKFFAPTLTASAFLFLGLYVLYTGHPNEDAYILFNYVNQLSAGNGIVYFENGPPTEGATDFLYMVLLSGLTFIGFQVAVGAVLINSLGVFLIHIILQYVFWDRSMLLPSIAVSLGLGGFILASPIAASSLVGFSTAFFSAACIAVFLLTITQQYRNFIPYLGLLAGLIRPEGVLIGSISAALSLFLIEQNANRRAYFWHCITAFILGSFYFIWRWKYFGNTFPLPIYVKSGSGNDIFPGISDNLSWALNPESIILICLAIISFLFLRNTRKRLLIAWAPFVVWFIVLFFVVQSQNEDERFQAPLVASLAASTVFAANAFFERYRNRFSYYALALLFLILASPNVKMVVNNVVRYQNSYIDVFPFFLNTYVNQNTRIALTEAGRMAFWLDAHEYDLVGLNHPQVAREGVTPDFISALNPDIIFIHHSGTWKAGGCAHGPYCHVTAQELRKVYIRSRHWRNVAYGVKRAPLAVYAYLDNNKSKFDIFQVNYAGSYEHIYAVRKNGDVTKDEFKTALQKSFSKQKYMSYLELVARRENADIRERKD